MSRIEEAKRPVKLERQVVGYPCAGNSFQFNFKLTYELPRIVRGILYEPQSGDRQILIFCQSRNDVESSLNKLLSDIQRSIIKTEKQRDELNSVAER